MEGNPKHNAALFMDYQTEGSAHNIYMEYRKGSNSFSGIATIGDNIS